MDEAYMPEPQRTYSGNSLGAAPPTLPPSLANFRDRLVSLHEQALDLEQMMRRHADNTFGGQPVNEAKYDDRNSSVEDSTNTILIEFERTMARLRQQCNRF